MSSRSSLYGLHRVLKRHEIEILLKKRKEQKKRRKLERKNRRGK